MIYQNSEVYSIALGCPWYEAQQFYGPANVKWCEQTRCSVIAEPANTWSNLSYLMVFLVGMKIYKNIKEVIIRDYALSIFVVGLCSAIYHATNNFLTQFLDFFGMFVMSAFIMSFQLQRFKRANIRDYGKNFWMFLFLNSTFFWMLHLHKVPVQLSMVFAAVGMIVMELVARTRELHKPSMKYFWPAVGFLGLANGFAMMDLHRFYCRPENIFLHGHALWHLVAGIGLGLLTFHLKEVAKAHGASYQR